MAGRVGIDRLAGVRRVYDAAQTPLERVLAGAQAKPERVAELKKLRQSLDPFQLGKLTDQKLPVRK